MRSMRPAFITCSDLHLRATKPQMRTDRTVKVLFKKFEFILKECKKYEVPLIIAGDLFEISTEKCPFWILTEFLRLINAYAVTVYAVYGQHDQRYHSKSSFNDTPYGAAVAAGMVTHLSAVPTKVGDLYLYGKSFGDSMPEIITNDGIPVLVTHEMVIKDKKLWKSQKNYIKGNKLLKNNDYTVIISGDNHQRFINMRNKKLLINGGSVLRSRKDQKDHKPSITLVRFLNTIIEAETIKIPIESDVFKESEDIIEELKSDVNQESYDDFIEGLKKQKDDKNVIYYELVSEIAKKSKLKKSVIEELNNIFSLIKD